MPHNSQNAISATAWGHLYTTALDAIKSASIDAKTHCIGTPLPLAYQVKRSKIEAMISELEELDPRNMDGSINPYQLATHTEQKPEPNQSQPFRLGDRVYCRHLRTTGEIKSISFHSDQDPEARIVSLHNGKLTWNWVSMNDLEPPLSRKDTQDSTTASVGTAAAPQALHTLPFIKSAPQSVA
ncbi:hypothetical protein [Pseudovibrio sp. Tun.PSC04-5.I4]|uniref:hypothetical protein n=1 Tax=Pseudovibrio sp. Tun.PSC04-5.I4 TaxID=1798213 RepID=UPI000886F813|nr:hypothetical protein [Pseudovibrio sp. Tun.PSC04-5.I4]SDQ99097.1 hypothetical protein SAMN04515695_2206 [Pseudovibrio sp. Tun.PSC04-5.I4]